MVDVEVFRDAYARGAGNIGRILSGWSSYDEELRSYYANEFAEILADRLDALEQAQTDGCGLELASSIRGADNTFRWWAAMMLHVMGVDPLRYFTGRSRSTTPDPTPDALDSALPMAA